MMKKVYGFIAAALVLSAGFYACDTDDLAEAIGGGTKGTGDITYSVQADGVPNTAGSTAIGFTFSGAVAGLTAAEILVIDDTGTATKGALTGSGTGWWLGITVNTAGNVKVAISRPGIESTIKDVTVHKAAAPGLATYSANANGTANTASSTAIALSFSEAVTDLGANDITVTGGTGSVTKGTLSGNGASWSLGIAVNTAGTVTVAINKAGIESGTKTVTVHKAATPGDVTYSASANGASNTADSTAIAFTFSSTVTGLTANDITVTGGTGSVAKGTLNGSGTGWSLGISVTTAGDITVAIAKAGIASGPKTVTVHKAGAKTPDPVTYSASANGTADTANSTSIGFTFIEAVTGLTAEQIAISDNTGSVTKGTLNGSGTSWSLGITVNTAGTVKVAINKPGIESGEKTVTVHKVPDPVTYSASADGTSNTADSTAITLAFNGAVTGLGANDITVTGGSGSVTKGSLSGNGTSWSLGIAVNTAGTVTVAITKPGIESGTKTVTVHKAASGELSVNGGFNYEGIPVLKDDVAIEGSFTVGASVTLRVAANAGYSDIKWYVVGQSAPVSTGNAYILDPAHFNAKKNAVTVTGTKDGKFYSRIVEFEVH
jgi:methionine-rich copper-binding protein CopC